MVTRIEGADPKLPVGTAYCQCGNCQRYFKSPTGFDLHRTGDQERRRCLSIPAMRKAGMSQNKRGYWVTAAWDKEPEA